MTRFIFIVVLTLLANSTPPANAQTTAAPETKTPTAIIKIRGKLASQNCPPGSDKLSPPESTQVRIIIGQNSWKIAIAEWKYSAPVEMFSDGTDTYYYIIARDFLPGHKLPGDEKIAYTCSIEPGEILPPRFWIDRLLATVYLSGKFKTTDHSLPPIEPNEDAPPTRNFTSTGDRLNALLKATFSPSTSQKALAANLKFPTVAELTATKTRRIADVTIPQSFICNFYGPSPFVSPTPTNIITTATYTFEADEITLGSPADLAYPIPKGIGSITDARLKETSRNNLQWLAAGARGKVGYEWSDPELPKRDTPNLLQRIPPLIYRGLVIERDGVLTKVDENDPAIPKP
jgi:hypothetical protein